MNEIERKDFYEKLYFHELDVREKIENRLKLPLGIFAIVFGMAAFLFNELILNSKYGINTLFWVIYGGGIVLLGASVWFFIRSWYGYTYRMVPTADTIENYYQAILKQYKETDEAKALEWTNEAFQKYLLSTFKAYASDNTANNDRKSFYLFRSVSALILSFFLVGIAFFPYHSAVNLNQNSKDTIMSDRPEPPKPPPPRDVRGQPPKSKPVPAPPIKK